jgi:2-polyprenyl-3-methyl-5-hydroxy-6-metoxy-1,4-benzoquinol methylase
MTGRYVNGRGLAHLYTGDLTRYFGCPVVGTFNLDTDTSLHGFKPCITDADGGRRFWLVRLNGQHYAWAYRWDDSRQSWDRWELVSKAPLPDSLREGEIAFEVLEPLTAAEARAWAYARSYWFQSFLWSPQRADSALVWDAIAGRFDWSGHTVLDVGCHYGYHCFRASKAGARVTGFDIDHRPIETARFINDHIESQDVRFVTDDPGGAFDTIFYLSVHHQHDPAYSRLAATLDNLRMRARGKVFVELIVPSPDQRLTPKAIDGMVGGHVLLTYQHAVRFTRRIYELEGKAV